MDAKRVGVAIAFLRKRAGYTQKDLADRIGITDKAVSKWERGLGLPDIVYLGKLAILLDTDVASLLAGDVVQHDSEWQGVIVLDKNSYSIGAQTIIYDKPLVYFLLSYFLLVGIRKIIVLCTPEEKTYLDQTLEDGKRFGIRLYTCAGTLKDMLQSNVIEGNNIMMVYGRCFLYGVDQTRFFQKAMVNRERLTIMALPRKHKQTNSRLLMDINKKVVNSNKDEPLRTQYDYSKIPILFFPANLLTDMAKEMDVATFVSKFTANKELYVEMLDRGFVEIEVNTWDDVQEAAMFTKIVQDNCGMIIYCLEEVAWRRGMITKVELLEQGVKQQDTEYGQYILNICNRKII